MEIKLLLLLLLKALFEESINNFIKSRLRDRGYPNNIVEKTLAEVKFTVFVRDVQSIHNLFYLLSQFESCSGLKINQSKSEILWLGCWRHRKDHVLDLKLSDEPIYALGVYFSYNEELATEKNIFDKLNPLKKLLNIWSSRDLSIYGRINIVKTLAISKLTFICSVLDTPNGFTDEVNNIIFRYIWKNKNPKLKKNNYHKKQE